MTRNGAFDRFRGIGAVCVVLLHAPPLYHSSIEPLKISGWALRNLCQVAVPFFFLLSGWMLGAKWAAGRRENSELTRSTARILGLYLPWFGFFLALDVLAGLPVGWDVVVRRLAGFSDGRLDTRGYHLWFLPSLILAQALVWLSLRRTGSAALAAVAGSILYLAMAVLDGLGQKLPWGLAPHEGVDISLACVGLGAWLGGRTTAGRHLGTLALAALALVWIEAWVWDRATGSSWGIHPFLAMRVVFPAVLLLWLGSRADFLSRGWSGRLLDGLGRNSTGIYVMHLAFLALVPFEAMVSNGFVRDNLVRWPVALFGSIALAALLRRAPWPRIRNLVA